jgi:hypothetical protein
VYGIRTRWARTSLSVREVRERRPGTHLADTDDGVCGPSEGSGEPFRMEFCTAYSAPCLQPLYNTYTASRLEHLSDALERGSNMLRTDGRLSLPFCDAHATNTEWDTT